MLPRSALMLYISKHYVMCMKLLFRTSTDIELNTVHVRKLNNNNSHISLVGATQIRRPFLQGMARIKRNLWLHGTKVTKSTLHYVAGV